MKHTKKRWPKNVVAHRVPPVLSVVAAGLLMFSIVITNGQSVPGFGNFSYLASRAALPGSPAEQLFVKVNNSYSTSVPQGGSYTLQAIQGSQIVPYTGLLDYYLWFCQTSCTNSTGEWGNYQLVNGQVVVTLPQNITPGLYYSSFRPRGLSNTPWSNWITITVTSQPSHFNEPLRVSLGDLSDLSIIRQEITVPQGGSYVLGATQGAQLVSYNGKLDYQLRLCQLDSIGQQSCGVATTGAWGDYTLVNGKVTVTLPPNIATGIYRASFKPRGSNVPWSNEIAVTVTPSPETLNQKLFITINNAYQATVAPGGSYTLRATQGSQIVPYSGLLDYNLRFCELPNGRSCTTSTGAWGSYQLVKGQLVVTVDKGTGAGIYNVSFRPRGSAAPWSNEVALTVTTSP